MDKFLKGVGVTVVITVFTAGMSLLLGFPTKWMWNWVMPYVFHLPPIDFWQGFALNYLGNVLFKSSYSGSKE